MPPFSGVHLSHIAKAPCFLLQNHNFVILLCHPHNLEGMSMLRACRTVKVLVTLRSSAGKMSPPSRRVSKAQHSLSTKNDDFSSLLWVKRTGTQDSDIQNFQIVHMHSESIWTIQEAHLISMGILSPPLRLGLTISGPLTLGGELPEVVAMHSLFSVLNAYAKCAWNRVGAK